MAHVNIVRYNAQVFFLRKTMKNLYKHISSTLKALRQEQGWSLDKAAEETGVSKAMLGQIERQESCPTIATLWKIASGFRTSFSSFIEDAQADMSDPVYRSGQTQQLHPHDDKIRFTPIFPFDSKLNFEIFIIELLPSCEHLSPPHKHGVIEHIIVVEGKLEVLVNGIWKPLSKGEGLRFNANQPHGYRNKAKKIARFHDIIHYP
jgi:transcriptional regulator with XRE-family HTH domain